MTYMNLSSLLTDAFNKFSENIFLENKTYGDFLNDITMVHQLWEGYNIDENGIIVLSDCGGRKNLLDILTAIYYGHKICIIHNRLFLDSSCEKLSIFGKIERMSCGCIEAIVRCTAKVEADIIASTSGTTGAPNLVQHPCININRNIEAIEEYLSPTEGDCFYLQRNPIYLSVLTGEVLLGIKRGCCFYIPEGQVNPKKLIMDIKENRIAVLVSVMSYFDTLLPLLRKNAQSLRSLKYLQFVGEGGRAGLIDDLAEILPDTDIIIGYGLTEAGPRISYMSIKEMTPKQYLVGKLLNGVSARAVNEQGEVLPTGEKGTIELSSPSLMIGYIGMEKSGHWFRTSDYGWLDENGFLYIQGRLDDIAIINGVKIPLITVEQGILKSGMVTGAFAFIIKNHRNDLLRVEVAVTTDEDHDHFTERLTKWCRTNLESILWPQKIHLLDTFIFKSNGKLDKAAIKAAVFGEKQQ